MIAEELKKPFRPKDMFSKAVHKTQLVQLKYKKGQNPDKFGTAIEGLEVGYRNQLSKDDKIATLMSAVGFLLERPLSTKWRILKLQRKNK